MVWNTLSTIFWITLPSFDFEEGAFWSNSNTTIEWVSVGVLQAQEVLMSASSIKEVKKVEIYTNQFALETACYYIHTLQNTKNWRKTSDRWLLYHINLPWKIFSKFVLIRSDRKDYQRYKWVWFFWFPFLLGAILFKIENDIWWVIIRLQEILTPFWIHPYLAILLALILVWYFTGMYAMYRIRKGTVSIENSEFEKNFDIVTTDNTWVRMFFDPHRLECTNQLKKGLGGVKIRILFKTDHVLVWTPGHDTSIDTSKKEKIELFLKELRIPHYLYTHNE